MLFTWRTRGCNHPSVRHFYLGKKGAYTFTMFLQDVRNKLGQQCQLQPEGLFGQRCVMYFLRLDNSMIFWIFRIVWSYGKGYRVKCLNEGSRSCGGGGGWCSAQWDRIDNIGLFTILMGLSNINPSYSAPLTWKSPYYISTDPRNTSEG